MTLIWLNFSYFIFIRTIRGERKATAGTLRDVVKAMVAFGIPFEEIEFAIDQFEENRHNYANFGVLRKSLIFTEFKKEYSIKLDDVA